jgi:hypothetical protein
LPADLLLSSVLNTRKQLSTTVEYFQCDIYYSSRLTRCCYLLSGCTYLFLGFLIQLRIKKLSYQFKISGGTQRLILLLGVRRKAEL